MEFLILLVPMIVTGVMFVAKWLAGLYAVGNGSNSHAALRMLLIVFSLLGIIASNTLNGTDINADSISTLVTMFLETGVTSFLSHAFYRTVTESKRAALSQ